MPKRKKGPGGFSNHYYSMEDCLDQIKSNLRDLLGQLKIVRNIALTNEDLLPLETEVYKTIIELEERQGRFIKTPGFTLTRIMNYRDLCNDLSRKTWLSLQDTQGIVQVHEYQTENSIKNLIRNINIVNYDCDRLLALLEFPKVEKNDS